MLEIMTVISHSASSDTVPETSRVNRTKKERHDTKSDLWRITAFFVTLSIDMIFKVDTVRVRIGYPNEETLRREGRRKKERGKKKEE